MQKVIDYVGYEFDFCPGGSTYQNESDSSLLLSLGCHVDVFLPPRERSRVSAPFILSGEIYKRKTTTIEVLPDECLFEVFRRLPSSQERSLCACVSKRWLMLLSSIHRDEMCLGNVTQLPLADNKLVPAKSLEPCEPNSKDLVPVTEDVIETDYDDDKLKNDGHLSRSLQGKKATDIRLAAIAVGTCSRGGLGKLSIKGSNKVTNFGLRAIACGCPSLRTLSLWNVSSIGDEGLTEIAKGCRLLEMLDLSHCPAVSDKALISIAENCPNLASLALECCPNIGNEGLKALGRCCPNLESVSIINCPLVGDQGVSSLLLSTSYSLKKLKLQSLNVSDAFLAVIGLYGKAMLELAFSNLQNVSEKGFWVMGSGQGLQKLRSFYVASCRGFTDLGLEAVGKGCPNLKQISLCKCTLLSDKGLISLADSMLSLENLVLKECHGLTQLGVFEVLSRVRKLKSLSLANCMGIKDSVFEGPVSPCKSLRSLSICHCPGFGNDSLVGLGKLCPQLRNVEFSGLHGITDEGFSSLIQFLKDGLKNVKLSGCVNLSDKIVSAICKIHGGTIEVLNLDNCIRITDASLVAISEHCLFLTELDVSKCEVTDSGIAALACAVQLSLRILSIAGCSLVSERSLPLLEKIGETLVGLNMQQCDGISDKMVDLLLGQLWRCDILY